MFFEAISSFQAFIFPVLVFLCGISYGIKVFYKKWHIIFPARLINFIETSGALFPFVSLLFLIYSSVFNMPCVVSESMEPTLYAGDMLAFTKFDYGLRLPLINKYIIHFNSPRRGDIVIFNDPTGKIRANVVKRVIGLPGDHIEYKNKLLTINGKLIKQRVLGSRFMQIKNSVSLPVSHHEEDLNGVKHDIYIRLDFHNDFQSLKKSTFNTAHHFEYTVPKDAYFVMGDNRDCSTDSRSIGSIPMSHILGKVRRVLFSFNVRSPWYRPLSWIRWERLGMKPA
jgi:signal peptidase I